MTFLWGWNPTHYTNPLFSKCVSFTACVCQHFCCLFCWNLFGRLHGQCWCLLVLAVPCFPLFRMRCHAPLIPITLHWAGLTTPAVGTCMPAKGPWSLGPGTDSPAQLWASVWVLNLKLQCGLGLSFLLVSSSFRRLLACSFFPPCWEVIIDPLKSFTCPHVDKWKLFFMNTNPVEQLTVCCAFSYVLKVSIASLNLLDPLHPSTHPLPEYPSNDCLSINCILNPHFTHSSSSLQLQTNFITPHFLCGVEKCVF